MPKVPTENPMPPDFRGVNSQRTNIESMDADTNPRKKYGIITERTTGSCAISLTVMRRGTARSGVVAPEIDEPGVDVGEIPTDGAGAAALLPDRLFSAPKL